MRFIVKSAFWLGLIAFLIPFGGEPKETSADVTVFGVFIGAQQAIQDLTGFCDRAPLACDTGRELAIFAGERIGDGIEMAYALVDGRIGERKTTEPATEVVAAPSAASATDPLATGTVGPSATGPDTQGSRLPAAYTPPKRPAFTIEPLDTAGTNAAPLTVALAESLAAAAATAPADADKAVPRPQNAVLVVPTPAPRAMATR